MRTLTVPVLLFTLTLAACGDSSTPLPTAAYADLTEVDGTAAVSVARPISGTCELRVTPLPSSPPILRQTDEGTCRISHLGRAHLEGVLEVDISTGTQQGERTLTASNGDLLYLEVTGTSAPSGPGLVSFVANLTFVGGTGRFANATGQAQAQGTANLATRVTLMALEGRIAYDASDRRGR